MPEAFQQYCKAAMWGKMTNSRKAWLHVKAPKQVSDVMELSVAELAQECHSYKGAHFILITIPKVHCEAFYDKLSGYNWPFSVIIF